MKITLLITIALFSTQLFGQINNADFENWTNLYPHAYEGEMVDSHAVANPTHGFIDNWSFDYDTGISQTTDAFTGTYAVVVHNWYNYAETILSYRDTLSMYPTNITGAYKYISGNPGISGTGTVIVKSTAGDTIINTQFDFGNAEAWMPFDFSLSTIQSTTDPADSIIIHFRNAEESCIGNIMTCNLLFLDNIDVVKTAGIEKLSSIGMQVFPNPTAGNISVEAQSTAPNEELTFEVIDLFGKTMVTQHAVGGQKVMLDLNALPSGYYILRVHSNDVYLGHERIMIR
jgi:hypothetical protein